MKYVKTIELHIPTVATKSIQLTIVTLLASFCLDRLLYGEWALSWSWKGATMIAFGYVGLIALHEACHLIGFRIFGNVPWKRMKFGVDFKLGVAYATMDQAVQNRAMQHALLLPLWVTGVVPLLLGFILHSGVLYTLAALLIGGAAGDLAMYRALRRYDREALIEDDPHHPRLYVYYPQHIVDNVDK